MRRLGDAYTLEEAPRPVPTDDGVLVRVERSLVVRGHAGERDACAGVVVATGRAASLPSIGARVAGAGVGLACHAELVHLPRHRAVRIPAELGWDEACFVGAGAAALHALRRTQATLGETVVLQGLGLTGLLAVSLGRAFGYRVFAIDADARTLAEAKRLGAELALPPGPELLPAILAATGRQGADRLILGLGDEPLSFDPRLLRSRAKVVVLGAIEGLSTGGDVLAKEIDLVPANAPGPGRGDSHYDEDGVDYPVGYVRWTAHRNQTEVLRLVATKALDVRSLALPSRRFEEARRPGTDLAYLVEHSAALPAARAPRSLPRSFSIDGDGVPEKVVAALEARGLTRASPAEAKLCLVGGPAADRAARVAAALDAGKDVHALAPLAATREALARVEAARARSTGTVAVAHAGRNAPHVAGLKAALAARPGAAVLSLRCSGPLDAPAYLGAEAADALDLLGFLVGTSKVEALEVVGGAASVVLLLRFEGGATASLAYAKGERSSRLEAFKGGAVWVLAGDALTAHPPEAASGAPVTGDALSALDEALGGGDALAATETALRALERLLESAPT